MPPPTSFITISSIPFSQLVTQAMFNVANIQWFKYTATVPIVIGMQTNAGGTFNPKVTLYQSDGTTSVGHTNTGIVGFWIALRTAGDYYIKVVRSVGGASNFDFTFTADTRPLDIPTLVEGDLIVNDDAANYPAIITSVIGVKFFASAIPAGELGAILPSNVSFWHDRFAQYSPTSSIAMLDANLTYVKSIVLGTTGGDTPIFATDVVNNKAYAVNVNRELWIIDSAGTPTNTGYIFPDMPAPHPDLIAVNETGTILYWANIFNNLGIIHALSLTTLTALPDLHTISGFITNTDTIAKTPNGNRGDMFVTANGNVVTWWFTNATSIYHLIVISSAGALLHSYDYSIPTYLNHLAYIKGDSDHIIAWWYTNIDLSIGRYGRINLITGVVDQDYTLQMFSEGINLDSTDKFGPSNSCTFVRYQGITIPVDLSGIYFVDPTKTHDTYNGGIDKKIPNPTIKTALIGD